MNVVVTGGASFIGSHLVKRLISEGNAVTIIDDLSSGDLNNLLPLKSEIDFDFFSMDLRIITPVQLRSFFDSANIIFHLAADHGGRGYVEMQQLNCSNNFAIDNNVLQAAVQSNIDKLIFASSGCIYPMYMQNDTSKEILLREDQATVMHGDYPAGLDGLMQPDGLYGAAKLVMEQSLYHAYKEQGLSSVSCRFFTVYGPLAKENHAIISFIARAFTKRKPFTVWGDGTQIRNWTYVDDIVNGLMLSMTNPQLFEGAHSINLGTVEKITVMEAVRQTLDYVNTFDKYKDYNPVIDLLPGMPIGPVNRISDNSKYLSLGGIEPLPFEQGLKNTIDWYFRTKDLEYIDDNLDRLLIDRK